MQFTETRPDDSQVDAKAMKTTKITKKGHKYNQICLPTSNLLQDGGL